LGNHHVIVVKSKLFKNLKMYEYNEKHKLTEFLEKISTI